MEVIEERTFESSACSTIKDENNQIQTHESDIFNYMSNNTTITPSKKSQIVNYLSTYNATKDKIKNNCCGHLEYGDGQHHPLNIMSLQQILGNGEQCVSRAAAAALAPKQSEDVTFNNVEEQKKPIVQALKFPLRRDNVQDSPIKKIQKGNSIIVLDQGKVMSKKSMVEPIDQKVK